MKPAKDCARKAECASAIRAPSVVHCGEQRRGGRQLEINARRGGLASRPNARLPMPGPHRRRRHRHRRRQCRGRFGGGGRLTEITYYGVRFDSYLAERLIRLLPEILHVRTHVADDGWLHSTIRFIAQEARQRLPGSETVITRLADILVIQAIRSWIESVREQERGWIAALHDRQIGKAMTLMHRRPGHDWRVASLAREIGMSRSGFSARFSALMGESVMQYLTDLRMQLAHCELRQSADSLTKIAERVGYHSEPAFNRAFKRVIGVPPGAVRKGAPG